MKPTPNACLLALLLVSAPLYACEPQAPEDQIAESTSVEKLLKKISIKLSADCRLAQGEEFLSPITIAYRRRDERRSRGHATRAYQGPVICAKATGELLRGTIKGKVTMSYERDPSDGDSCDGEILIEVTKLSSSMTIQKL